ncbi:hypothetical protein ACHAWF_005847 [Thalassiosira exigua]
MKIAIASLIVGCAAAFAPGAQKRTSSPSTTALNKFARYWQEDFTADNLPGIVAPTGFWDPLDFASKAGERTLKRYREAEVTHGRVSMLATVGFLAGEAVESKTYLFNGEVTGPAISHLPQVNPFFWLLLGAGIAKAEIARAEIGWVEPSQARFDQPGLLRDRYYPGDIGFDPLGLKPTSPDELNVMLTKELQHGRLAMIGAAGMLAQEAVDGKGIVEHFSS